MEYDVIIVGLGGMARPVPTPWPDVPVVGEVVADLVTTGATDFDLEFLSPPRFTSHAWICYARFTTCRRVAGSRGDWSSGSRLGHKRPTRTRRTELNRGAP